MAQVQSASQRWVPMTALGASLVLVFMVMPNPFRQPQNDPTASAEYAPVPGRNENAQNANFGETDLASSGGIGSGGEGEGFLPGGSPIKPPPQYNPRQKECVGNPPRQTEDELAPPCVPFFDGDGGSSATGVTKDSIKVVFYNDLDVKGDMNAPWRPSDEKPDHQSDAFGQDTYLVRTIKAQLAYFNKRFQTYGRRVDVEAVPSSAGLTTPCPQRATDAALLGEEEEPPFAVVHFGDGGQCFLEAAAAQYGIMGLGVNADVVGELYDRNGGLVWSFFPDQETEAGLSASFICRTLYTNQKGQKGKQPARFSTDPNLVNLPRKFGFIHPKKGTGENPRGPEAEQLAELLKRYTTQECGIKWDGENHLVETFPASGDGTAEAPQIMQKFKSAGVTTVICYCVPVTSELTVSKMQNAASQANYYPEWFWDHGSRMFRQVWNQRFGDSSGRHVSFGINPQHWFNGALKKQHHYQAYLTEQPETVPNTRFNFDIYHLFLNLFQGIQGAGSNLNNDTMKAGMFTFTFQSQENPQVPTGGYGPYGDRAIGDYTWIDTAHAWWWDRTGTPPGGKRGEGCLRGMNKGYRYYRYEFPLGDASMYADGAPCGADDTVIEPNSGIS